MLRARYQNYHLNFALPAGTSRGIMTSKETFFLYVEDEFGSRGAGECALFRGLSAEDSPEYIRKLDWAVRNINLPLDELREELREFPSILIGIEQAFLNLQHQGDLYFPSAFTEQKAGIKTNGLIWMGSPTFMLKQIKEKMHLGYTCIKLKIGTDWQTEQKLLQNVRTEYPNLEIRVDANGAFTPEQAMQVLDELEKLQIHSIEQPIRAGNLNDMHHLCHQAPIPIALDEELIGVNDPMAKMNLLDEVRPHYIILKPSLVGGFYGTNEWIAIANHFKIGWWITSALESNLGLNALAQFTYTLGNPMPQGLGTGKLFTNNTPASVSLNEDILWKI